MMASSAGLMEMVLLMWALCGDGCGAAAVSVDVLCSATRSAPSGAITTNGSLSADGTHYVTQFVHHVIRSLEWKTMIVFAERSSDLKEMTDLLADDTMSVMVFQWSLSAEDSSGDPSWSDDLNRTLTSDLSPHILLLGSAVFVMDVLQEVLQIKELPTVTTDWLTTVPRDQVSSIVAVAERFDHLAVVVPEALPGLTLETVVRQGDTTRLSRVTEWSPCWRSSLPPLTEAMVFPNKQYGLGGRTLKMMTMTWDPFVIRHEKENITWYTGLCIDLLHMLASSLNFTYIIAEPADRNWGQRLANGTWVGLTGILHRREADFALSGMSVTAERATVSDYSRGFYFDELVMVTALPDPDLVGWDFLTRPFHWLVFLLLGCGFLFVTLVLALIDRWYGSAARQESLRRAKTDLRRQRKSRGHVPLMSSILSQVAEVLFGSLLARAVVYTGASASGRILLVAWLLLSLVTVATYTGKLTSISVVTKQPVPFTTLSELVRRSDYTWGFSKGTMMENFIGKSTNKDYQLFYRKMHEFEKSDPDVRTGETEVNINKLLTENYVRLTSESFYRHYKQFYCRLTIVRERLAQDTFVVYFQKGSPYTAMFDQVIGQATESGLLGYLMKKWFPEKSSCQGDEAHVMSVSLELMVMAFLLAGGGVALASGMLVLEFMIRSNQCRRQQELTQPACLPTCCL